MIRPVRRRPQRPYANDRIYSLIYPVVCEVHEGAILTRSSNADKYREARHDR